MEIVEVARRRRSARSRRRSAQGQSYFADASVYVEKLIVDPRHVEVQVLADAHGNVIHLGERDCTIQRRHQKLVEETPSPAVDAELRARIGAIGVDAARACGYRSAGTIEGLLTRDGDYFFMEMNTRIQVEHTVTELVTGLDLVREQILLALGEPLSLTQDDVSCAATRSSAASTRRTSRRAFCRRRARDRLPRASGPGVRVDSGVAAGNEVSGAYDPMIAKLIVHGADREHAAGACSARSTSSEIEGPKTLIGFHQALLSQPCFIAGETCHGLVESDELAAQRRASCAPAPRLQAQRDRPARRSSGCGWSRSTAAASRCASPSPSRRGASSPGAGTSACERRRGGAGQDAVVSPMQGTVLSVASPTATSSRRDR